MSVVGPSYAVPFNEIYVVSQLGQITGGQGQHGAVLENLVAYLIRTVPGLRVARRILGKGGEIDLLVSNSGALGKPLRWFTDYFLVECKDVNQTVGEKEFGHFLTKMNLTKTTQGAIVSRKGLSGSPTYRFASRDQKLAYSEMGVAVLDLKVTDFQNLSSAADFLTLLQLKYEELRFGTQ